jgi:predicted nucleotidyltransferase
MKSNRYWELRNEVDRIVRVLVENYSPEKIILYGSTTHGKVRQWSDLDIVVIKNTDLRFYDRIGDVLRVTRPHEAVDFLVYTPKEFSDMKKYNYFM